MILNASTPLLCPLPPGHPKSWDKHSRKVNHGLGWVGRDLKDHLDPAWNLVPAVGFGSQLEVTWTWPFPQGVSLGFCFLQIQILLLWCCFPSLQSWNLLIEISCPLILIVSGARNFPDARDGILGCVCCGIREWFGLRDFRDHLMPWAGTIPAIPGCSMALDPPAGTQPQFHPFPDIPGATGWALRSLSNPSQDSGKQSFAV